MIVTIFIWGFIAGVVVFMIYYGKNKSQEKEVGEKEEKILGFISKNERITNDEVEELLGVSNTTAYRYLEELEQKGKLRQVGKTGRSVYYEKKN